MAKKSKKGEKVDLSTFLGPEYTNALPSAPSAAPQGDMDRRDRRPQFGEDSGGADTWRRGPGGGGDRGGGGYDRGEGGGRRRFDNDSSFGRGGGGGEDDQGEWRCRRRGGEGEEPAPRSAADEDNQWRKSRPPMRDEAPPPRSVADEDSEWRKNRPASTRGSMGAEQTRPSVADEASEWRRRQPMRQDAPPPPPSMADEATEWRRREPLRSEAPPTSAAPAASDQDSNWRKNLQTPTPRTEESQQTPKPSESGDWRSNKPQLPSEPRSERPPQADAVDNWRTASKQKKRETPSNKREFIPIKAEVLTPYGKGTLLEHRASDNTRVVKLESGGEAFVRAEDVLPSLPKEVNTPYGKGNFDQYRFADGMCEVVLEFGAKAYIRAADLIPLNRPAQGGQKEQGSGKRGAGSGEKSAPRNRRFGDLERDREREKAFGGSGERKDRRNKEDSETPSEPKEPRPSKSEVFAAFSSGKDKNRPRETPPPTVTAAEAANVATTPAANNTAAPPPSVEERDKLFSAFGGGPKPTREPRMSREEKEKAFAAFSQGKRGFDSKDRVDRPPMERGPFPGFGGDRQERQERPSFPGFGGDRQERQERPSFPGFGGDRQERQERPSFPGFERRMGGERGERGDFGGRRGAPPSAGGEYVGGMERLNAGRSRASEPPTVGGGSYTPSTPAPAVEEFPALGAKTTPAAEAVPKSLPKGSKWGEADDEVVPSAPSSQPAKKKGAAAAEAAPSAKKIPLELALPSVRRVVKDFMTDEDKSAAIAALKQVSTEDDKEFLTQFVSALCPAAYSGTKPKKLVASLLVEMAGPKANLLTSEILAEGLTRSLEASAGDEEKLVALKDIFATLQEKYADLGKVDLREAGSKLRGDGKNQTGTGAKDVDSLAAQIYGIGKADEALAKMKETAFDKLPGAGLALLKAVLKDAKLDDGACPWISKNAKILAQVLYNAPEKDQLQALEAIQVAFNGANFPKTSSGAVIDSAFTRLYNLDVLPDSAFIAWKDDLSLNAPGRNTAIIQTTKFFQELEAEEYDEEEDE